ncbi:MAG TPA: thioredoxin [Chthoniobacteraceae bacterium]|nr:thioredoxin [Chthoniobacteraceae bacterium]
MASENVINLTEATFDQEIANATTPILVDFWATWCGPCKMIAPILDEIADEKGGAVKVAKVDVDQNGSIAARYGVRAIPTLLFIKNGEVKEQVVGMTSKKDLLAKLDALA